mmetsp:Transcript_16437/g.39338  ORF Transcript_16437/g.39338 Transcript_16437/m.39338 type:complete len:285 (+) Transcript_16437:180-1034(+)|eukprot:CAMPEP_0181122798 /NCGR_PEP_ID=MMETSP1071-20121207/25518_1 /TAXON_ID=35127 /ORGANISM="Thalassiosira sp., Strain NH16" /LENGTH=284 /DNA_ID=CAMNT_0023207817 /DNA_START=102 /DNA_END=956 /DNA_ORIENTATION=-
MPQFVSKSRTVALKQLIQDAISSRGVDDLLGGRDPNDDSVFFHVCKHPPKRLVDNIPALVPHYYLTTLEENNCANASELRKAATRKKSKFYRSLGTIRQQETHRLFTRAREQPNSVVPHPQIQSLEDVTRQALGGLSNLKESTSDLKERVSDLTEGISNLKGSVSDLKETAREHRSGQIQEQGRQISDLTKTVQDHGGRILNLENTNQVQGTLLANLQGQVQTLTFRVGDSAPMSTRVGELTPMATRVRELAPRANLRKRQRGRYLFDFNSQIANGAFLLGPRK